MLDWDVFAPVAQPTNTSQNDSFDGPADGVFFRDDNDDNCFTVSSSSKNYSSVLSQQPQSLNVCKLNDGSEQGKEYMQPKSKNFRVSFDLETHSYCDKKIHLQNGDIIPIKFRNNNNRRRRNGGFNRDMSDTADISITSISHELLKNGFNKEKYDKLRSSAIEQRNKMGSGKSSDMNSLFYFWCYYLRDNFDKTMYDEFLSIAKEDAKNGSHYGIECFFRFCSYGLEKNLNNFNNCWIDFQKEALDDFNLRNSKYGLEKLKGFLVHQKLGIKIELLEEVEKVMKQFPTLESFQDGKQVKARSIPKSENKFLSEQSDKRYSNRGGRGRQPSSRGASKNNGRGRQGNRKVHPSSVPTFESSPMKK